MWDCTPCSEITTSFIWVTSTPPHPQPTSLRSSTFSPPSLAPSPALTPKSFCNVIDSILRKCIYFQIKYLFKELLHVWCALMMVIMQRCYRCSRRKKKYRNTEGLLMGHIQHFPACKRGGKHTEWKRPLLLSRHPEQGKCTLQHLYLKLALYKKKKKINGTAVRWLAIKKKKRKEKEIVAAFQILVEKKLCHISESAKCEPVCERRTRFDNAAILV